jgi:hypothetical protein
MAPGEVCVYCKRRPVAPEWKPFCSERCKMADLGRWLSDNYRVAGDPLPPNPTDEDA